VTAADVPAGSTAAPDGRARIPPGDRVRAALEFAAVTLVALAAFTWHLLPDVGFWDTAIFQAAPPVLGLTHPTGYPTFNLLGWLWTTVLPLGNAAYEMNLFTAVTGALAVGMVFTVARQVGAGALAAAAAALTCGLMVSFWRTAGRADPHPLHVLFALAVISLLLAWDRGRRPRMLVLAALVFALGMGNHLLMTMLVPGVGVYVITARPSILREPKTIALSVLALAAGLLVYAYVPLRAAASPPIRYDFAPTTPDLFLRYVLGQDFSGSMAFFSPAGPGVALRELGTAWQQLGDSLTVPVAIGLLVLAVGGTWSLLAERRWRTTWLLLSTGGLTLYARLTYQNGDLERYALVPVAVLSILAAAGVQALLRLAVREVRGEPVSAGRRPERPAVEPARLAPALLLAVPLALVVVNGERVSVPNARCYVDDVVARAPQDAAIVAWWSVTTPLWYTQAVEGRRPDLTVVSAGSTVVEEIERFRTADRPVLIIQLDGEVKKARDAGYPMEEERFCGVGAWRIVGPPGTASRAPAP
jgi:Protein O-mannosyl-transferase TMEM260-like